MSNLQQQPVADSCFDTETDRFVRNQLFDSESALKDTVASSIEICGYGVHKLLKFSCRLND